MAKLTIGFGVALIVLGAWGFFGTGGAHPTALIPAYFGLALAVCGGLAQTENAKQRMLWMHGDGGAAGVSGGSGAGGGGVYQGARRAADGCGGGCGEVPGGDGGVVRGLCGAVRAVVYCGAARWKAGGVGRATDLRAVSFLSCQL
jgi:hypothetical protein